MSTVVASEKESLLARVKPSKAILCLAMPATLALLAKAVYNIVDIFMFDWGFGMGVEGASLATTVPQFATFAILVWFYRSGRSTIQVKLKYMKPDMRLLRIVALIGVPSALIQICLAVATSLTNIAAKPLSDADLIIAAYGVVQRLVLIGCYMVMGLMQGYQPVAAYS